MFENYSAIPPDDVVPHIAAVRAKLWDIRAYPCTGVYAFLVPWIRYHMARNEIVQKLNENADAKFLDVGSYIGHDLRALHFDGASQSCLYGLDILPFWDLGYELFRDEGRFAAKTVIGDILDASNESDAAQLLDGKMDVLWISAVLHQFTWDRCVQACKRLVRYAKGPGSLIVGAGVGSNKEDGESNMQRLTGQKGKNDPYKQNKESMERLWRVVGEELGVELGVQAVWRKWEEFGCEPERCKVMGPDMGVLEFTVRLL